MIRYTLLLVVSLLLQRAAGQINMEWSAGQIHMQHFSFVQANIDSAGKYSYFGSTLYRAYYTTPEFNLATAEAQVSRQLFPGLGVAMGLGYDGARPIFSSGLNLEWANKRQDVYVAFYPVVEWSEECRIDVFGIAGYEPEVKQKWAGFYQGVFSFNRHAFHLKNAQESEARLTGPTTYGTMLRFGWNYRNRCRFGLAMDIEAERTLKDALINVGVFFRWTM